MRDDDAAPDLVAPGEAARMLKVDPKTVTRWAISGRLSYVRLPSGHRRYRREDVQELMNARRNRS